LAQRSASRRSYTARMAAARCGKPASGHGTGHGIANLSRGRLTPLIGRQDRTLCQHARYGLLDALASRRQGRLDVLVPKPFEHHPGREDGGKRIGDPLAGNIRSGAVGWLENGMTLADIGGWSHAHAADQARCKVGEDVAQQVLRHQYIELRGTLDQVKGLGIDVGMIPSHVRIVGRRLIENLDRKSVV